MKKDFVLEIYKSKNTVFKTAEIAQLLEETNKDALKSKINYYLKKGVLKKARRGIYVKPEYNIFELATKIYTPSYISLETVLEKEGIIFQHYETIFVCSYLSRQIEVEGRKIQIRRIKEDALLNPEGIEQKENYAIATKERAFLDALYLYKNYYFDNLKILNKKKVFSLLAIYNSKRLFRQVKKLLK